MCEIGSQLSTTAVNATAHRAKLNAQRGRDLLVGEALDVAQHDRRAVIRRQRPQRRLNVAVNLYASLSHAP